MTRITARGYDRIVERLHEPAPDLAQIAADFGVSVNHIRNMAAAVRKPAKRVVG